MGARARISQYGRRRDPLAAARMMYGAAPHAQYMQQMPEMDRYGSWYNPLSWWSPKKPELMYDDEGAYYEDPYEQELATNPHRYDLEGFNVTVSPKEGDLRHLRQHSEEAQGRRRSQAQVKEERGDPAVREVV